jgi:hypothetical protein
MFAPAKHPATKKGKSHDLPVEATHEAVEEEGRELITLY